MVNIATPELLSLAATHAHGDATRGEILAQFTAALLGVRAGDDHRLDAVRSAVLSTDQKPHVVAIFHPSVSVADVDGKLSVSVDWFDSLVEANETVDLDVRSIDVDDERVATLARRLDELVAATPAPWGTLIEDDEQPDAREDEARGSVL